MKYQMLFSGENIINLSSAELVHGEVKVKTSSFTLKFQNNLFNLFF